MADFHYLELAFTPSQWTSAVTSVHTATAGIEGFAGAHARAFGISVQPQALRMGFYVEGLLSTEGPAGPFGARIDFVQPMDAPPDDPGGRCPNCHLVGHSVYDCPFP